MMCIAKFLNMAYKKYAIFNMYNKKLLITFEIQRLLGLLE